MQKNNVAPTGPKNLTHSQEVFMGDAPGSVLAVDGPSVRARRCSVGLPENIMPGASGDTTHIVHGFQRRLRRYSIPK